MFKNQEGAKFLFIGLATGFLLNKYGRKLISSLKKSTSISDDGFIEKEEAPAWIQSIFEEKEAALKAEGKKDAKYVRCLLREWEDEKWRRANGWLGNDLCHSKYSEAVFVKSYYFCEANLELIGIVNFGKNAESHRGFCHGGSFTSVFDDIAGHICFFAGKSPWVGATVQINCSLAKPILIGSTLLCVAKIDKRERKKVFISAELIGPHFTKYAKMDGISIDGVAISKQGDAIEKRTWLIDNDIIRDSGYELP